MLEDRQAYTIEELTKLGPLGRTSIYQAISKGQLTARKFGRSTIVLKPDWDRFLQSLPAFTVRQAA